MSDFSFCLYTACFSFRFTYLLKEVKESEKATSKNTKILSLPQGLKIWTNFFILIIEKNFQLIFM